MAASKVASVESERNGDISPTSMINGRLLYADEYGTDLTLRFKKTTININALTMISKRVERDECIDVYELVRKTADALSDAKKRLRYCRPQ